MAQPRVAVGGILTECNHFGGLPVEMANYVAEDLYRGEEMRQLTTSVVGGMWRGLEEGSTTTVPLIYAAACSGGPITESCYEQLRGELLDRLKECLPVDGVLMPIHGAALAEEVDDPEGDMLQAVRQLVGNVPIVATLDLHAHVTQAMVRYADALLGWETYPHRDQFTTGIRAAKLLLDTIAGTCRPTMAMAKVPVITSAVRGSTDGNDPFADLMRLTKSLERQDDVLSSSLFLIHPYMDVEDMGSGGLVITDGDPEAAVRYATRIGEAYWSRRHDLEPDTHAPSEAIRMGRQIEGRPVILVEAADCCGGGAAGDSIHTLRALVADQNESGAADLAYVPVVAPQAAAACHQAGAGSQLTLKFGHQLDPRWGEPESFTGIVEKLHNGSFVFSGGQWEGHQADMGPTAVFRIGSISVLLTSRSTYDWADEQFQAVGLDPRLAKLIVAKNPMNYRHAYGSMAAGFIILDTPGPTPPTLKHATFRKMRRPYFPADEEITGLRPTILQ